MAQRRQTILIDDLTDEEFREGDGGVVSFGLDGIEYEMDLTHAHHEELRRVLSRYVSRGRRREVNATGGAQPVARRGEPARIDKAQLDAMRSWARGKGVVVSDRGRISAAIHATYHLARGP